MQTHFACTNRPFGAPKSLTKDIRAVRRSHVGCVVPWQQLVDIALHVPVDDRCQCGGEVSMRFDTIEFAGLDQRGHDTPVLSPDIMTGE